MMKLKNKYRFGKKIYLILFCLLTASVIGVKAQPGTSIPNPFTDTSIIPASAAKTALYATSTSGAEFVNLYGTTIAPYGNYGISATPATDYRAFQLNLNSTVSINESNRYLYFMYYDINTSYLRPNSITTSYSISSYDITGSSWKLGVVDLLSISSDFGDLSSIAFQTLTESRVAYVANVCLASTSYTPPGYPREFVEPSYTDLLSIYSDLVNGNNVSGINRWGSFPTPTIYTSPEGKTAYRITVNAGGAQYSQGFRFNLNSASQKTLAELADEYEKIHFDLWSPAEILNNYLRIQPTEYSSNAVITTTGLSGITAGQVETWVEYDFNLSDLFGSDLTKTLGGIQFTNGLTTVAGSFFIDNIYFYNPPIDDPYAFPEEIDYPTESYGVYYDGTVTSPVITWTRGNAYTYTDGVESNVSWKIPDLGTLTQSTPGTTYSLITQSGRTANYLSFDAWALQRKTDMTITVNGVSYTVSEIEGDRWNRINIPLTQFNIGDATTITSVSFTGNTGEAVHIDNIVFYYSYKNPFPVAEIDGYSTQYYTIRDAVNEAKILRGDVRIGIIANSTEETSIYIDPYDDVSWETLTIYPRDAPRTVTYEGNENSTWRSLFVFSNKAGYVTFDGKLNGKADGTPQSLIFVGKGLGEFIPEDSSASTKGNNIIEVRFAFNVTITDCKFTNTQEGGRPVSAIQSNGNATTILNNHFENCLLLGRQSAASTRGTGVVSVDGRTGASTSASQVEISGNSFYETDPIGYTATNAYRAFIKVFVNSTNVANPVKITNNKIGGSAPDLSGTMTIGAENSGSVQGTLYGIYLFSGWLTGTITSDATNAYMLVQDNEIANINMWNNGSGLPDEAGGQVVDQIASFTGINSYEAFALIKGNKIHDITLRSEAYNGTGGSQRHFMEGIYVSCMYKNHIIIENNDIANLDAGYINDAPNKSVLIAGIYASLSNNDSIGASGFAVRGTIRNNRIVMGHSVTKQMYSYSDIAGISARLSTMRENAQGLQLDVYNNMAVFNESKVDGLRAIKVYDIVNQSKNDRGVINCYNNITLVQPKDANSFSGTTPVVGIHRTVNNDAGTVNLFHNTVLLMENSGTTTAALCHDYREPTGGIGGDFEYEEGNLGVWNNNFVNLSSGGLVYYAISSRTHPKEVYFNYNNYYVPADGYMAAVGRTSRRYIETFDNWKFSNFLFYFSHKVEHDHQSRFLYPCFSSSIAPDGLSIPVITNIAGIESVGLQTLLVPKRFIGGGEATPANVNLWNISISETNGETFVSTTAITSTDDNKDYLSETRRRYLPTMGALNTNFDNYYTGSGFQTTPDITNTAPWLRDLVFAENASGNYTLADDVSIHDIYNDTNNQININGKTLTVTGYIGLEGNGKSTINASATASTIVYNGNDDGHDINGKKGAAAQHIFKNTFVNNQVNNFTINNNSQYFVLLHGEKPQSWLEDSETAVEPSNTLNILNDFTVINANTEYLKYPEFPSTTQQYLSTGTHLGGLNCTWYNTELVFTNTNAATALPVTGYSSASPQTYRPYAGQRIPRHGIFNDSVYNLISNSTKVITYHDYLYVNNDLTIQPAKNFEIAADKYVKVLGLTANNGQNAGLTIKSREEDDADESALDPYLFPTLGETIPRYRPNATFIFSNPASSPVSATVEMYSHASRDSEENLKPRWQYFTSPVADFTYNRSSGSFEDVRIRKWLETFHHNYIDWSPPYWEQVWANDETIPSEDYMNPSLTAKTTVKHFEGYEITLDPEETGNVDLRKVLPFTGNLTNQDFSNNSLTVTPYTFQRRQENADWKSYMTATYSLTASQLDRWTELYNSWLDHYNYQGQHILGNPYTAALPIADMNFGTGTEATVYLFNTGSRDEWLYPNEGNPVDNAAAPGEYLAIPQGQAEVMGIPTLASMQGFLIKTTSSGSSFGITYNNTTKNTSLLRSSEEAREKVYTIVEVEGDHSFDRVWLFTEPGCRQGFDNGLDGHKMFSNTGNAQLMTVEANEFYQVSSVDNLHDLYLGIKSSNLDTDYTLTFKHFNTGSVYERLYLLDLLTKQQVDVTEDGTVYRFTADNPTTIQRRFKLVSDTFTSIEDIISEDYSLNVYNSDNVVYIDNPGLGSGKLFIYDISGILLQTHSFRSDVALSIVETGLAKGFYILKIVSSNGQTDKTVIF